MISENEENWEEMLPNGIAEMIKTHRLFGCTSKKTPTLKP